MSPKLAKILCAVVFLFLGSTPAISQSEKGQISGQVADPQGLAVVNVTVEIVNQDSSAKREMKTDETGHYAVPGLAGGRYKADKDKFTEMIEYVSGAGIPESFVGSSFEFTVKVDGEKMTKIGTIQVGGQDFKIDEKWERCKP